MPIIVLNQSLNEPLTQGTSDFRDQAGVGFVPFVVPSG
jgi:hypothetical protein